MPAVNLLTESWEQLSDTGVKAVTMNSENGQKIKLTLSEVLGVDEKILVPSSDFENDLNLEKLEVSEALVRLAERLGIDFSTAEIENIKTVGQVLTLAEEKLDE